VHLTQVTGAMVVARQAAEATLALMSTRCSLASEPIKRDWIRLTWSASEKFVSEMPENSLYKYDFLVRLSREDPARLIITSSHGDLVEALLRESGIARDLRRPRVQVAALVKNITESPDEYHTTVLYARVDGFGQALRTIAFFGDDITGANLSRDILQFAEPFRTTLRPANGDSEVLSVGSKGEVSFMFNENPAALDRVDRALRFIKPWTMW
jgi:hypothetical protein